MILLAVALSLLLLRCVVRSSRTDRLDVPPAYADCMRTLTPAYFQEDNIDKSSNDTLKTMR